MGDITGSSKLEGQSSSESLIKATNEVNARLKDEILSPFTVTLGDEFQGVTGSATAALNTIFTLQQMTRLGLLPELHYAWVFGPIDTKINAEIAHGMLGPALSDARRNLTRKDRDRPETHVELFDLELTSIMKNTLRAMHDISNRWKQEDLDLIEDLLGDTPITEVAKIHQRDTSSVYRRRETLMTETYKALEIAALSTAIKHDTEFGNA